jgi:hypothetical protein
VAQAPEWLPKKCEALSSNFSTTKKPKQHQPINQIKPKLDVVSLAYNCIPLEAEAEGSQV